MGNAIFKITTTLVKGLSIATIGVFTGMLASAAYDTWKEEHEEATDSDLKHETE